MLPFPIHDPSIFLAARGKAAPMLTLTELKNMADIPVPGQKAPTAKGLRASEEPVAEHILRGGAVIAAYKSGYAVYSVCGAATVFCIHSCGGYCYDSGENPCNIGSRLFEGEAWYLRLVLEGEDRLCHNRESMEQDRNVSYSSVSEEWGALDSGEEPVLKRIVQEDFVEVTRDVYLEWHPARRRERYQAEKKQAHGVCSLEAMGEDTLLVLPGGY